MSRQINSDFPSSDVRTLCLIDTHIRTSTISRLFLISSAVKWWYLVIPTLLRAFSNYAKKESLSWCISNFKRIPDLTHLMSSGDIEYGTRPVLHHVAVGQENVVVVQALLVPPHVALINNGQICNVTPSIRYCTNNRKRIVRLLGFDEILNSTMIFQFQMRGQVFMKHWWDGMGEGGLT